VVKDSFPKLQTKNYKTGELVWKWAYVFLVSKNIFLFVVFPLGSLCSNAH
jgi:hypothetical protein